MIKEFKDKEKYLSALLEDFSHTVLNAIKKKGFATVLLSGGSSPLEFYERLSTTILPWECIRIGLVDERFVDPTDDFSNEKSLHTHLLKNKASKASFYGMVVSSTDILSNWEIIEKTYSMFIEADYILLGMGEDGHTASIFPNDINSDLTFETNNLSAITNAPKYPIKRITCTPKLIKSSTHVVLVLTGERKKSVYEEAQISQLPVSKFTNHIHQIFIYL
jgi:6-phosphogluconolactonase